jgi:hypothetical protein
MKDFRELWTTAVYFQKETNCWGLWTITIYVKRETVGTLNYSRYCQENTFGTLIYVKRVTVGTVNYNPSLPDWHFEAVNYRRLCQETLLGLWFVSRETLLGLWTKAVYVKIDTSGTRSCQERHCWDSRLCQESHCWDSEVQSFITRETLLELRTTAVYVKRDTFGTRSCQERHCWDSELHLFTARDTVGTLKDSRLYQETLLGYAGATVYIATHCWNNKWQVTSRNERFVPGCSSDFETVAWGWQFTV